jgi:hypothetical protein
MTGLYETDFYQWTVEQSQFLALGKLQSLDLENLFEEIESLGKQQQQDLENRLAVLLGHLLKWNFQPDIRTRSWRATIKEQRLRIQLLLKKSPSLKSYLATAVEVGYSLGVVLVEKETPFDAKDLPAECPYAIAQIFDVNFPDGIQTYFD